MSPWGFTIGTLDAPTYKIPAATVAEVLAAGVHAVQTTPRRISGWDQGYIDASVRAVEILGIRSEFRDELRKLEEHREQSKRSNEDQRQGTARVRVG